MGNNGSSNGNGNGNAVAIMSTVIYVHSSSTENTVFTNDHEQKVRNARKAIHGKDS